MLRQLAQSALARAPRLDALFRQKLWSRMHFPEAELRLLASLPANAIDCAVDVGAALGSYSWVLARKARQVIAYEPGELNGDWLATAVRGTGVELVRAAVGSKAGSFEMFTAGSEGEGRFSATLATGNPVAADSRVTVRRVPVVTLDEDLPPRLSDGASVDLIKIDVEGYENDVISGACETIARWHPVIVCEIEARHNPDFGVTLVTLADAGYRARYRLDGRWHDLQHGEIAALQQDADLDARLKPGHDAMQNRYINNFVFTHPASRLVLP